MCLTLLRRLHAAFAGVVGLLMLLYSTAASSAPIDKNIIDSVLDKYQAAATSWGSVMIHYASWLFWSLVLLSMVWTYGMMALRKADIQEFLAETVRFLGVTGFFWWILSNGPLIAHSIVESMSTIGATAIGQTSYTPNGIVEIGLNILFKVLDYTSVWSPVDSVCGIIIAIVVLIILALVSVNLLLLFISAWVLVYGGVFFLGFGGGRWTQDIAINYYKTVLGVGAQIMAMLLIIGIGKTFVDQYYASMSVGINLKELAVMLVVSLILLYLTNKIPPLIGGIVGGGGATAGIGNFGAGAAVAAAATGAAVAAAAGSAIAAGVSSAGGGVSALKAAFQSAQQNMASGGGSGSGSGGNSAGVSSGGSSSFMSAMGTTGRFAADMGTSLAKGVGQVAKDKAGSMIASAKERVADTTGGKVASAIRNSMDAASGQNDFKGDSLAGAAQRGSETAMNDEVAAFVNKGKQHE
ncbi:P-type conjugative transfer protein TrbL (plasmid) [Xylella fastidiosa subsp. pauca]|uniref:P-type conjugative transfer protein TrbL n=1 Tax=Xylella fastidiosa TaxID=2371 RepID=UPI0006236090|nr:P-type conjugative transfer protein TrbL [Xylella fastidiosa]ARO69805.1 P-type conjugative transfer protein TrbL [Xylella fastidiosa subsp. pauca]AVI21842.1 P-type conjugative transfer protein TrbL [Xylella fastidiosa]AVI23890.1 P-type conjugative transfer protein TrbL [Xylella fastidiosa]KXB09995.1 conjugal transfer protein TrbL [Xylella fastidiosa]